MDNKHITQLNNIQNRIFTLRGKQIMLDSDLAELYKVETKVLNQAVKRNLKRFPETFRFRLSSSEKLELVTNCDRLVNLKHSSTLPYAFTEQGVSMLSAVLKSEIAIEVSIKIIESFVNMRKLLSSNTLLFDRFERIENKLSLHDDNFNKIFDAIESKEIKAKQGIFYNGQIFDAYIFVVDLIKTAKTSIVLIDNYVDESVLTLLSKRKKNCIASIYTQTITKQLKLDLQKHNCKYPDIEIKTFKKAHDRFLIIDQQDIYHIGASLKDLGKKWFAFSKFEIGALEMLEHLKADGYE
jgi:hypothetical protein